MSVDSGSARGKALRVQGVRTLPNIERIPGRVIGDRILEFVYFGMACTGQNDCRFLVAVDADGLEVS